MPLPAPLPRCRIVVLGGGATPAALEASLRSLLDEGSLDSPIDVFAAPLAQLAASPRLRWHAAESSLPGALARLPQADGDVAWLLAGVRMPVGGLRRLQVALHAESRIGSASPLCDADPLYSPAEPGRALPADPRTIDAWLDANAPIAPVELPAPLPWCGVLRAECRPLVAGQTGGVSGGWPAALARAGWLSVACARVLVAAEPVSEPAGKRPRADSTLLADRRVWRDAHPLTGLRWKLAKAADGIAAARPAEPARPAPAAIRLHVAHSWGGGLSTWVTDFCDADEGAENLVLRSIGVVGAYGQRLALYRGSESAEPLRIWELALPIHASAIAHLQYRSVLREIAADFGVDCVIVSSLIGHSLDALRTGLPTLLVAHDHYPFCVAIFAFNGGECRSCDRERLQECMASNPGHRFFGGVEADDWIALREAFVCTVRDEGITLVAPSPSVRDRWRSLMPALAADVRFELVPHGASLAPAVAFEPPGEGPLRLVKLGRLSMEKGGELLEAILPSLAGFAHLTLIGCGEDASRLGRLPNVDAIAEFDRDRLPGLIAQARPHLGLQLSVVPETFSYTLSELWHCGVPVLASRIGSLADRVRDRENGYLVETNPQAVLAKLREIDGARQELAAMRRHLLSAPARTRGEMVGDYRALLPAGRTRISPLARDSLALDPFRVAVSGRVTVGPISVDPEVTYLRAARAFLRYTIEKAAHSPRLPAPLRRLLGGH